MAIRDSRKMTHSDLSTIVDRIRSIMYLDGQGLYSRDEIHNPHNLEAIDNLLESYSLSLNGEPFVAETVPVADTRTLNFAARPGPAKVADGPEPYDI